MYYLIKDNYYRDDLDNREVIVSIHCITYNHEKYIAEALEGFIRQKTNFRFEAVVHDDCSSDGTAEIIRQYAKKYPSIIKPIFETENQYSKQNGSLGRIMAQHLRGKYVAYCEGDDYWTDPLKLQKQVDYLESHPDCSLCCSSFDKFFQKTNTMQLNSGWGKHGVLTFNDIILHNSIATLTVVIRAEIYPHYKEFMKDAPFWPFGDYPLWLFASTKGYIWKFTEETAVYRILEKSASRMDNDNDRLRWANAEFSMFDYVNQRFIIPKSIYRKALFYRCYHSENLAAELKDPYLIGRIKSFYHKNHFFLSSVSFYIKLNMDRLRPLSKFLDSHLVLKAPLFYLKKQLQSF